MAQFSYSVYIALNLILYIGLLYETLLSVLLFEYLFSLPFLKGNTPYLILDEYVFKFLARS